MWRLRRVNWPFKSSFCELYPYWDSWSHKKCMSLRARMRVRASKEASMCLLCVIISSLFFFSPTDLRPVITSPSERVCLGTAALLSLCASRAPSASTRKKQKTPRVHKAVGLGELKATCLWLLVPATLPHIQDNPNFITSLPPAAGFWLWGLRNETWQVMRYFHLSRAVRRNDWWWWSNHRRNKSVLVNQAGSL